MSSPHPTPRKPLRCAVFSQDTWHPAALIRGHLPLSVLPGTRIEWFENPSDWQRGIHALPKCELLVLAKGNTTGSGNETPWLSPEREAALVRHVHSGRSALFIHGGTCYGANPALRAIIGGAFLRHPPPCPITLTPASESPLTHGLSETTFVDEHYEMIVDDPSAEIFLHTKSAHGIQPAGWTRTAPGRVCVLTPGHTEEAWASPAFQRLLTNALSWLSQPFS